MSIGGDDYDERERVGRSSTQRGSQTRIRLPDGDAYAAGRRSRGATRPSKGMLTVVGVVVLLMAAIAFVNRGDGGGGNPSGEGGSSKGAVAEPTAPTGEKPVTGSGAEIASGFPKTEQGAQSAAANYAVALGGDGMFHTKTRRQIVTAVYAPDVAAERRGDLDRAYSGKNFLAGIGLKPDGTAPGSMTFVSRTNPIGTKLETLEGNAATVAVWYSALFGLAGEGSKNPVAESWYTTTFDLKWVGNDWKVTDFEQKEGPTPVGRDQAASSAEDMAKAVEGFGGFTYAR